MTEHDKQVAKQRKLLRLEEWRKGIKFIYNERKDEGSPWKFQIIYFDDSETLEWSNTNHKQHTPSPHDEDTLIDMMESAEHEYQRKLFNQRRDYETTI